MIEPAERTEAERLAEIQSSLRHPQGPDYGTLHNNAKWLCGEIARLQQERDTAVSSREMWLKTYKECQATLTFRCDQMEKLEDERDAATREAEALREEVGRLQKMAAAAEEWYWAFNKASLDMTGSHERVFDALRLLGRYPPSAKVGQAIPDSASMAPGPLPAPATWADAIPDITVEEVLRAAADEAPSVDTCLDSLKQWGEAQASAGDVERARVDNFFGEDNPAQEVCRILALRSGRKCAYDEREPGVTWVIFPEQDKFPLYHDVVCAALTAAHARGSATMRPVVDAARKVLAQYEPHEIVDAEAELRDALTAISDAGP